MADVAKYIKIFITTPDDAYVAKRITAVNAIETAIRKITVNKILDFANGIISSLENPSASNEAINSIATSPLKKSSTSFVADEEQLQLLTCTLLAVLQYLEKAKDFNHSVSQEFVLALALWSGLSFQKPIEGMERLETLRSEILGLAVKMVHDVSINSRTRMQLKPRVEPAAPTENTFVSFIKNTEKSYGEMIDALRFNSNLDAEELDILWWIMSDWSGTFQKQVSVLNPVQKVILSCIEIGKMLRRFPAQAHSFLACKGVNQKEEYTGPELLEQLGELKSIIIQEFNTNDPIIKHKEIFPVFNFLISEHQNTEMETKRTLNEWSSRIMLELSLLNVNNFVE